MQVDWNNIGENVETNDLFNVNLPLLPKEPTYNQFNYYITKSAEMTAGTINRKKQMMVLSQP